MKFQSILLTVCPAFAAAVSGTPTAGSTQTTFDINFDERTVIPAAQELNPVGTEDTIFFNAWDLNNPATGVIPHSPPNVIVTGTAPEEENGTASLTVLYPGSKVKSFDLHYFWFGCALDTVEGTVTTAIGCEINVAGFRNNKEVASATFDFVPTAGELTATPMIQAKLPNTFKDLQNITFAAPNPSMQIINADDFSITTYT